MRLSPLARTFLAAAGLAIIAPAAAALAQQQPPGTPKSTHGAWSVICGCVRRTMRADAERDRR